MNKLIINQQAVYELQQESITDFPSLELTTELNLKQTDWVRQQLINKVAVKASYMHKSLLTDDIIEEIMETHKIIGVEPHLKYLIVEIENTTNDKTFPVKVDIPTPLVQNKEGEEPLIVTYNVEDISEPIFLFVGAESIGFPASAIYDKIEIDNVEIDMSNLSSSEQEGMTVYSYGFTSGGQHTVKYTLKDPTMIGVEIDEETDMPSKIGATFISCSNLTSITIPNSVTSIGVNTFYECFSLSSVTIPNSVTSIGKYAFNFCSGLTSITIPNSVTSIGDEAFVGCDNLPTTDNIRYADTYAVGAVDRTLTEYTIKSGTKWIGDVAFQSCSGLTSITIPNSVTSICDGAFNSCGSLTSITIPDGVTIIGRYAFAYCRGLTSVTVEATTPPTLDSNAFNTDAANMKIYVPAESIQAYKTAWSEYADIIFEAHEYVDLGLPSHTLWATMNVGATSVTDYGNYYMYGMGSKTYDNTDTPYAGTEDPLATSADTAAQVWGGSWHMPTREQMQELTANTTYQWVTNYKGSGINGGTFTATNGAVLFLPAAGVWSNGSQNNVGGYGGYWSSSPSSSNHAYNLGFNDGFNGVNSVIRKNGYSVRPVVG